MGDNLSLSRIDFCWSKLAFSSVSLVLACSKNWQFTSFPALATLTASTKADFSSLKLDFCWSKSAFKFLTSVFASSKSMRFSSFSVLVTLTVSSKADFCWSKWAFEQVNSKFAFSSPYSSPVSGIFTFPLSSGLRCLRVGLRSSKSQALQRKIVPSSDSENNEWSKHFGFWSF